MNCLMNDAEINFIKSIDFSSIYSLELLESHYSKSNKMLRNKMGKYLIGFNLTRPFLWLKKTRTFAKLLPISYFNGRSLNEAEILSSWKII